MNIHWSRSGTGHITQGHVEGVPLVLRGHAGVLSATIVGASSDPDGPLLGLAGGEARTADWGATLRHRLRRGPKGEVVEARLRLDNLTDRPLTRIVRFLSSAFPSPAYSSLRAHLPLTFNGSINHGSLRTMGEEQVFQSPVLCGHLGENRRLPEAHYLEPAGSDPAAVTTRAPLLIPLVDFATVDVPWRVALFGASDRPWRIAGRGDAVGRNACELSTRVDLAARGTIELAVHLYLHEGDEAEAWAAFHAIAHHDPFPRLDWPDGVRAHYYDFLSPGLAGPRRGPGFDEAVGHFRRFRIGLATQHGYYPGMGDYLHPDRPEWLAMPGDASGPWPMSLASMRARIAATRAAGAKAAVYIHFTMFDTRSTLAAALEPAASRKADGTLQVNGWHGPDVAGDLWQMSLGSALWRDHLLQQVAWIVELLDPDALVIDESFSGVGYQFAGGRVVQNFSPGSIQFFHAVRRLLRAGRDRALFVSDCGLGSTVLWADGEVGDHAYRSLLGREEYRREPVRYLAALGRKPWLPCAWMFRTMWEEQLELAHKVGAALSFANGWHEYGGLLSLTPVQAGKMTAALAALADNPAYDRLRQSPPTFVDLP